MTSARPNSLWPTNIRPDKAPLMHFLIRRHEGYFSAGQISLFSPTLWSICHSHQQ